MVESIILTDSQLKKFLDSLNPLLSKEDYELQLSAFQELKKEMYLFSWEKVQKKINKKFTVYLKKRFDIEWVITANIEKLDNTIKVSNEENHFLLKLNSDESKVNIEIDDGRTDEFVVKNKNDELRIYKEIVLPYILNVDHLASVCGISPKQLHLFISNKRKAYSTFKLPKKRGGFRSIDAPSKSMKLVQRWILHNILYKLNAGEYAHGFIPKKSIATNASVHDRQELVFGIDLKNFFPSITLSRVIGLFRSIGYTEEISHAIGELCTFNWRLPQGAPTSPMISNLIAWRMDIKLSKFCNKRNLNYSRYADDITISGGKNIPRYKTLIFRKIREEGFKINLDKVRLHDRGSSQRVTGLVVNDKVSLGKKKRKWLRAIVYNIANNGPVAENRNNDPFFKERVFGHLALAKMIEPDFGNALIDSLENVDWENYSNISKDLENSELSMRSFKRTISRPLIPFDELGFFKNVKKISQKDYTEELLKQLNDLQEKCKPHPTKEECMDCLFKHNESYEKCIKYILAQFIGDTCGTHHGHEIYDIGGETILYGDNVFVGVLAKSGLDDTQSKDSLLRQFLDCTDLEELNIISIATPRGLDSSLTNRINRIRNKFDENKRYCMILRKDMGRILYSFNMNYSNKSKEKEVTREVNADHSE